MRIFTTRAFSRLDVAGELSDTDLIAAVVEMNDGLWDANLGGQVYKKRVALAGRGKSGVRAPWWLSKAMIKPFLCMALPRTSAATSRLKKSRH